MAYTDLCARKKAKVIWLLELYYREKSINRLQSGLLL
jgi:hypothetical protein